MSASVPKGDKRDESMLQQPTLVVFVVASTILHIQDEIISCEGGIADQTFAIQRGQGQADAILDGDELRHSSWRSKGCVHLGLQRKFTKISAQCAANKPEQLRNAIHRRRIADVATNNQPCTDEIPQTPAAVCLPRPSSAR